jgi:hypothetical protein
VHDRVEIRARLLVAEDELAELLAIERAIASHHVGTELLHDRGVRRLAGFDDASSELIGVDVHCSVLDESSGDGGLP